jgi:hypothetical protein
MTENADNIINTVTDTEPTYTLPSRNDTPTTVEDLQIDTDLGLPDVDLNEGESGEATQGQYVDVTHVMSDLWVGSMEHELVDAEFDAVLTLAKDAGHIPDTIRHRHVPLGTHVLDTAKLDKAVNWAFTQWKQDRTVLVRCDYEIDRAALVVALVCVEMGGNGYDAIAALGSADIAIKDFRYRKHVYDAGEKNRVEGEPYVM